VTFSQNMRDENIYRVTYPDEPERDAPNRWGHRVYYHNATREGGDYEWHADNLHEAPGAPRPEEVTAAWTFGGRWDPEATEPPKVVGIERDGRRIMVRFDEDVSVKGEVGLALASGGEAIFQSGSGGSELVFEAPGEDEGEVRGLSGDGVIVAAVATRRPRVVSSLE
jgi:pectinesterase